MNPIVSVICLCYNHERFIKEALDSLLAQTYPSVEIIIIDDASTDHSKTIIADFVKSNPGTHFIFNEKNAGSCSSFNKALRLAKGKYIIDFATDDVMTADKIARQVEVFEKLDESYGVVFTNAENIDESSKSSGMHFKPNEHVPQGNVYTEVLKRFFIPTVTMMVKKNVFDELGGYDESLAYEDFDFWVRSSNRFKYQYLNEVLMKRRIVQGSLSSGFLKKGNQKMIESTFRVCEKAMWLNKSREEEIALVQRINIEMRLAYLVENFKLVEKYGKILKVMNASSFHSNLLKVLSVFRVRIHWVYRWYLRLKN